MKSELLKQRDVIDDGIPYGNIKIRIDEERVELQQDKDLIFISVEKIQEFLKILKPIQ